MSKKTLKCPVCESELYRQEQSYRCEESHTFDVAKEGYLNLLLSHQKHSENPGDSKEMVRARKEFLEKGFYKGISDQINKTILRVMNENRSYTVLDVGCGEGYYLNNLIGDTPLLNQYFGLDISKHAIKYAAKQNKDALFLVGNNYFLPFQDATVDVMLSVFSPIDLAECKRIAKKDGNLVRVYPKKNHLIELKKIIYPEIKDKGYEQYEVEPEGFSVNKLDEVYYKVTLSNTDLSALLIMTPHFWRVKEEHKRALLDMNSIEVTINVGIVTLKKHNQE